MTAVKAARWAMRRQMMTWGAGLFIVLSIWAFTGLRHQIGQYEVGIYPVLSEVSICQGEIDKEEGRCKGSLIHYAAFSQTSSRCEGRDAMVAGYLSKVRTDAKYEDGKQIMYFGDPNGRFRRTAFQLTDQEGSVPTNRPTGVQDWGEWRLVGGCATEYSTWFTTVEHSAWHGLWPLPTLVGPFPLPPHPTS